MKYRGIGFVIVCGFLAPVLEFAIAQAPAPPSSKAVTSAPFTISTARSATAVNPHNGQHAVVVTLKNVGNKPVVAYILRIEFLDETGKPRGAIVSRIVELADPANPNDAGKLIDVGQQWQHPKPLFVSLVKNGVERNYRVTLDYVCFSDGSSWGPDVSKMGKELNAYVRGFQTAKRYLGQKLQREGPEALKEELSTTKAK